jgi:hypothetical protein
VESQAEEEEGHQRRGAATDQQCEAVVCVVEIEMEEVWLVCQRRSQVLKVEDHQLHQLHMPLFRV